MFQTAELGQSISQQQFKKREPKLRKQLLDLQARARANGSFPVLIDFAGVSGAGKSTSTNMLNKWMDPRWIQTQGYNDPAYLEQQRPELWRFWRDLPARGQIGIALSGRYSIPLLDFVYKRISQAQLLEKLERIKHFEQLLANDGALVLKFWMHISQDLQAQRLKALEADPLQKWKMSADDWNNWKNYDRFIEAAELIISHTSTGYAPWLIVEGQDMNYRHLEVGEQLRDALENHLTRMELKEEFKHRLSTELNENGKKPNQSGSAKAVTLFDTLDLSLRLNKPAYNSKLVRRQAKLASLYQTATQRGISSVVVFEGPDAAGKGGAIRNMIEALDARTYDIYPTAAPTEDELAHHYLWRFWRHLPRAGRMSVFDRSWYGRVLVERVEGFAQFDERAYNEINEFEKQLLEQGIVLVKFWLHIDKDEQSRRFKAREEIPWKKWKLTDEDWRNHGRWQDYQIAAHDMVQKTSMQTAPWTVIESQDKQWGRIRVLETLCLAFKTALARHT
jgi:polyphosphate:AMP phosphotransferase